MLAFSLKSPCSALEAKQGQKKSMAIASKAICHTPKLLIVSDGLEPCVQKSVGFVRKLDPSPGIYSSTLIFIFSFLICPNTNGIQNI